MSTPASGVLRLTRAAVLGAATVGLALGAHVAAGGASPTPVGLGLLVLPVLAVTLLATGRRLTGPVVAALLGLGQAALHLGLTALTASPSVAGTVGGGAAGAGPPEGGHHLLHLALGGLQPAGSPDPAAGPTLVMTVAHLAAAALVALLLTRGEHALWALLGWLLPRLPGAAYPPAPARGVSVSVAVALPASWQGRRRRCRAPPAGPAAVLARPSHGPVGPLGVVA